MSSEAIRRIIDFLASVKLALILLVAFGVAIAAATFVESDVGTAGARALVYGARWFEVLLALITLNLLALLVRWFPLSPRRTGFFLVHLSMIVILIGAGLTRYFGQEGTMHIREGEQADTMLSREDHVQLAVDGERASFPVRLFRSGPQSLSRTLSVGNRSYRVSVSDYWPHYEMRGNAPDGEEPSLQLTVTVDEAVPVLLRRGSEHRVGTVRLAYLDATALGAAGDLPLGSLEVQAGGARRSLPISGTVPATVEVGGFRATITEFQPDFTVGGRTDGPSRMSNPMLRVEIVAPGGQREERMLFAYHPEFAMQHEQAAEALTDVETHYRFEPRLLFAGGADSLVARGTMPLVELVMRGGAREQRTIPPGREFNVQPLAIYRTPARDFSVVLRAGPAQGSSTAGPSADPNAPAAVRLNVEETTGESVEALLVRGTSPAFRDLGDERISLAFGPVRIALPYSLHLDDFVLLTYPGSDKPSGYESHVRLSDPDRGIVGEPIVIRMNTPLTHRSRKHFQSSYDRDNQGTILTVNHDPGKWPTYVGYSLITLGFLLSLLKGVIWRPRRQGPERPGTHGIAAGVRTVVLGLVIGLAPLSAARAQPAAGHVHGDTEHASPEGVLELPADVRADLGALVIQDFQGRMKPLETLAHEVVRKVTKRDRFQGWLPLDLYLSWIAAPDHWWEQPLLFVRNPGLKDLLGVDPAATHVAAGDLFGADGDYLLLGHVETAYRTPDRDRSKVQRKLIAFDERMNLLYLSLRGETLRVFPVPGDPGHAWDSGAKVLGRVAEPEHQRYRTALSDLLAGLQHRDAAQLTRGIETVRVIQADYGAAVLPSSAALQSELFLNRTRLFSRVLWPYLFSFLLLLPAYLLSLSGPRRRIRTWRRPLLAGGMALYLIAFVAHLAAYVLRWIASGRAPLSNGFESLLFISLAVGLAGILFEWRERRGAAAGLSALLAFVILGISMASHFDPAIGLLVPVLDSNWLIIHVTVITASYGFLGLGGAIGALILGLYLFKRPGRDEIHGAILKLDQVLFRVISWGIALLTVGTLLGGVWANESWGRYWGWDPKETWSLITILFYAVVQHLRWLPVANPSWAVAAGSLAGIASIVMTYFGVNYFLSGLHSYAEGSTLQVPTWVYVGSALMVGWILLSHLVQRRRRWDRTDRDRAAA